MANYLVMKISGTSYINNKIKNMIKDRFQGLEFVEEKDVVDVRLQQGIDVYEALEFPNHEKYIKEKLAVELGKYLLDNNLISFTTEDDNYTKTIKGKVILIRGD